MTMAAIHQFQIVDVTYSQEPIPLKGFYDTREAAVEEIERRCKNLDGPPYLFTLQEVWRTP